MKERVILKQSFGALAIASALMLSACGEDQGWAAAEHKGVPYGEEYTAGTGIKYVRAYMLPEKGPALDPIMDEVDSLLNDHSHMSMPAKDETVASAEPIFTKKLKK